MRRPSAATALAIAGTAMLVAAVGMRLWPSAPPLQLEAAGPPARCHPVPTEHLDVPGWLEQTIAVPTPAFATVSDVDQAGITDTRADVLRTTVVLDETIEEFQAFVASHWAQDGWTLLSSDSEPGEAEGLVAHGDTWVVFRIRDAYCDADQRELRLVVTS